MQMIFIPPAVRSIICGMLRLKKLVFLPLYFLFILSLGAQEKYTVSGYVSDAESGETLIGASVFPAQQPELGTATNTYGFFSLTLPEGDWTLVFSYLGYQEKRISIELDGDNEWRIQMEPGLTIEEVVVSSEQEESQVSSTAMGQMELDMSQVGKLPTLMGEVDVLRTLQLLPGVISSGEGNTGFFVRGGGPDQNLVLLDEAVVYNSGHLLGFFSVFNSDAIKNTTLIKGGMPAMYGGRLSSVVDVQMKEGNNRYFGVKGGLGLLAARLTAEGPIIKDRSSFLVSARRTYAFDLAQPFLKGTSVEGTNYFFYDLNAKVNHRFSSRDRLYLSAYFGRDVLDYVSEARGFSARIPYGNATATLRWNHLFSDQLFLNVSAVYNNYNFAVDGRQSDFTARLRSGVRDLNLKADFDYYAGPQHQWKFGAHYTWHKLTPDVVEATSGDVVFSNELTPKYAHEAALYVQDEISPGRRWKFNLGLRGSWFAQVGPYSSPDEVETFEAGELIQDYWGLEPRFSGRFQLTRNSSLKAGFTMAWQYLHLVSNSTSTLPFDVWVPSSRLVEPQLGFQYALGYFRNFAENTWETSVEVYYRDLNNQIDYRENYVNDPSTEVERNFVFGEGRAYGIELFLKKRTGRLNGWLGYTLSRTERSFPDIEDGRVFPAVYDRPHDLSLVLNYQLSPKWELGFIFVYGSGRAFTPIKSLYLIENNLNVDYGRRNSARLDHYHRADVSATWTPNPDSEKNFTSSWNFSIYNLYSRQNPLFFYTAFDTNLQAGTATATAYKVSLFPIIPSITWNFQWKDKD